MATRSSYTQLHAAADVVVLLVSLGCDLCRVLERFAAEFEVASLSICTSQSEAIALNWKRILTFNQVTKGGSDSKETEDEAFRLWAFSAARHRSLQRVLQEDRFSSATHQKVVSHFWLPLRPCITQPHSCTTPKNLRFPNFRDHIIKSLVSQLLKDVQYIHGEVMLLAQINHDSQGVVDLQNGGGDAQHVTLCLAEAVTVSDGNHMDSMDTVSLQAVTLADGSTAYIQHNPKVSISDGKLMDGQVIQLEDGSAAYVQHVSMPKAGNDSLRLEDGQAVQLEDGTTAYIHAPKETYDHGALQAVQLEDGTTAYIQHTVQMPQSNTILAIQADGTVSDLNAEGTIDDETISVLEHYAAKAETAECVSSGLVSRNDSDGAVQMQIVVQGQEAARGVVKVQPPGEKSFRCGYSDCGKLYTTAHHLKVHERSHTGDRPYLCDHLGCGKKFATGYGLKSHVRTHTGEKPYRCQETNCRKSFKTSGDLQKHIRTHTGERPFMCPFEGCGRSFTTSNIRKVHIRTHTGERPYYCPEPGCGRAFASATNYKNHMRIHTGEKPYVCTVPGCDKRFTEYSSLYKHHVVHTPCKPYNCNHCGKTYKQISTLAMHKRTAHNDTEPIEEEQEAYFEPPTDAIDDPAVTYVPEMEEEDSGSEHVSSETAEAIGHQHVALITQDGTQQLSISQADVQAIGNTITMVTQDGTTITVPAHEAVLSSEGTHSVSMVAADGTNEQVTIVTPELTFHTTQAELVQDHEHHLVTASPHPVTLLATSNGTQIAVQLSEQPSLEEAIRIASRIQQGETPGLEE